MSIVADFECRLCGEKQLVELPAFSKLPRVTSDCKPFPAGGRLAACRSCGAIQKPADRQWCDEAAAIYREYDIYFQSGGIEQAVFDMGSGIPRTRSAVLLDRLNDLSPLGPAGRALDVGCGKGTFLRAFAKFRPGWQLFGHELSNQNEDVLKRIPRVQELYTGPISELPGDFDLITFVHALEHFENPVGGVRDAAGKLKSGGKLVIEVPNGSATPFDLVIADHASHFSKNDLRHVVKRAGLSPLLVSDRWMAKELSVVAVPGQAARQEQPEEGAAAPAMPIEQRVAWLETVIRQARNSARQAKRFGIFGTSIASMWLFGELGDSVAFFVDEDPSRAGTLHGRPVISPRGIPSGASLYMALLPNIAASVAARIGRSDIDLIIPPAFNDVVVPA